MLGIDPKNLGLNFHHGLVFFSQPLILVSLIVWLILTFIIYRKAKNMIHKIDTIIFLISYFVFIVYPFIDPFGIQVWFMD